MNFNNATERRVVRIDLRLFDVQQLKLKFYDNIHTNVALFTLSSSSQVPISMWLGRSGAAVVVSGAFVVDPPNIFQSMIPRLIRTSVLAFTSIGDDEAGKASTSNAQQATRKALFDIISTLRFLKTINNTTSSRLNWTSNKYFSTLSAPVKHHVLGEVSFRNMRFSLRWEKVSELISRVRLSKSFLKMALVVSELD